ncbi:hypothetical protein FD021_002064 [Escherichia coli]|nr:hypothetical protein [Escherichia coli]
MIWQPEFTDKTLSRKPGAVQSDVAASLGATPMQVALAWLLQRSPNILLIPGTSSVAHLRENMAAEKLHLSEEVLSTLDGISRE